MDRHLIARANELATQGSGPVAAGDALRKALDERCGGDYGKALDLLVDEGRSKLKDARKSTYTIPEQPTLFDIPAVIAITTPLGDLFIPRELATNGQVDQWLREGEQHHGSQHKRFKSMRAARAELELDPSENHVESLRSLMGGEE